MQLGSFGDCLYATAVARQIKLDNPGCYLGWMIGSHYASVLEGNPYVDGIINVPMDHRDDIEKKYVFWEAAARHLKDAGHYDEVYFTQVFPDHLENFDGTLRSSIFRGYPHPISNVRPVMRLMEDEIDNVRGFVKKHNLRQYKKVILFECLPKSGQSFVTPEFALEAARGIVELTANCCVVLSTNKKIETRDARIIDGSELTFRENAELANRCDLLIGCSSGITWLGTSDWVRQDLPMVQLLSEDYHMYASVVLDHETHGLPTDNVIEMTECIPFDLILVVDWIFGLGFERTREHWHEDPEINLGPYACIVAGWAMRTGRYRDMMTAFEHAYRRFGINAATLVTIPIYGIKRLISK